jgi:competence protein ComEA
MLKTLLTGYLSFTRKERFGIILLLCIIVACAALPLLYPWLMGSPPPGIATNLSLPLPAADSATTTLSPNSRYARHYQSHYQRWPDKKPVGELFYFDPNTATEADWQRLGLRDKTIGTLLRYRAAGGRFRQPEDLAKIWGLHPDEVQRLLPYVRLSAPAETASRYNRPSYEKRDYPTEKRYATIEKKYGMVDINRGDTTDFIRLPGIGPRLAARIVAFRNKLGGFYTVEQVAETFGLPDSTFQHIKERLSLGSGPTARLNINSADLATLRQHPYIRYPLANAIVQYRNQHGPFAKLEDLRNIMLVTEEGYQRMAPYLALE